MAGQILVKYIRKGHGKLVGAVVASGNNKIGWSVANKEDRPRGIFNKDEAVKIALERSLTVEDPQKMLEDQKVAVSARKEYRKMINRAKNFKGF